MASLRDQLAAAQAIQRQRQVELLGAQNRLAAARAEAVPQRATAKRPTPAPPPNVQPTPTPAPAAARPAASTGSGFARAVRVLRDAMVTGRSGTTTTTGVKG